MRPRLALATLLPLVVAIAPLVDAQSFFGSHALRVARYHFRPAPRGAIYGPAETFPNRTGGTRRARWHSGWRH